MDLPQEVKANEIDAAIQIKCFTDLVAIGNDADISNDANNSIFAVYGDVLSSTILF